MAWAVTEAETGLWFVQSSLLMHSTHYQLGRYLSAYIKGEFDMATRTEKLKKKGLSQAEIKRVVQVRAGTNGKCFGGHFDVLERNTIFCIDSHVILRNIPRKYPEWKLWCNFLLFR
jgi:hypothetical protein